MSVPTHEVAIVHPNEMRRNALKSALNTHRVSVVGSQLEATRRMEATAPTLIIAPADNARRFLRHVDRSAPEAVCVFVCARSGDQHGLEELVETAAEGHVFSTVDDGLSEGELSMRLRGHPPTARVHARVAGCRDARGLPPARPALHRRVPGPGPLRRRAPGPHGRVDGGLPSRHAPGRAGHGARRPARAARGPRLRAPRHARPAGDAAVPARGHLLAARHGGPTAAPPRTLRDAVAVQAALRKALRRELPVWLHPPDSQTAHFLLESATVEPFVERGLLRGKVSSRCP